MQSPDEYFTPTSERRRVLTYGVLLVGSSLSTIKQTMFELSREMTKLEYAYCKWKSKYLQRPVGTVHAMLECTVHARLQYTNVNK